VGLENSGPIIGFSSSDTHLDLEIVFSALAIVAQKYPYVKLLITGDAKPAVLKLAQEYHVEDRLILTGFLPFEELPWHLGCADLFVLPFPDTVYNLGRWPNKICDYMSLGRPTVSNPCGDIKHLFDRCEIGLLAEWNEEDFANKIVQLLEDPNLAHRLGEEARRISVYEYSWPVLVARLEGFYWNVLEENKRVQEMVGESNGAT
jgi:phosphatidylinositol alpha-1,6-mannosyltransferase